MKCKNKVKKISMDVKKITLTNSPILKMFEYEMNVFFDHARNTFILNALF